MVLPAADLTPPMRRPKARWGVRTKLLALLTSSLVAFLLVELGLRLLGFGYPEFIQFDDRLGFSLTPGASGWFRSEGRSFVLINGHGMRDAEHATRKPAGVYRIAVLGDSYAEAFHVPQEKAFWSLLTAGLARCPAFAGKTVEVLNFGVSGYGTAQEFLILKDRVWDFQPDLVLLAFFAGNDVRNNSKSLEWEPIRPFYVFRDGRLVLEDQFRSSKAYQLRRTALYRLFYFAHRNLRTVQLLKRVLARTPSGPGGNPQGTGLAFETGLDTAVFSEPKDPRWADAWKVTEGLLAMMRDEVQSHGSRFCVVSLTMGVQVHPDPGVRDQAARTFGVDDLFYPDRRVVDFLGRIGVPAMSLAPAFQSYAQEHKVGRSAARSGASSTRATASAIASVAWASGRRGSVTGIAGDRGSRGRCRG
jgi:hypothetical protein